ncbi:MAG: hypothetical protein SGILL_003824, partial [Bacillariaceae sp.]
MATSTTASSVLRDFDQYQEKDVNLEATASSSPSGRKNVLFTPKFQASTKNNPMCGICFPQWISILRQRWKVIEFRVYWRRLVFITLLSIVNSLLGVLDYIFYESKVEQAQIHPRPVFILGHPRTGTTLLQSLLAMDTERFGICSTFCAGFPSSFLSFEGVGKILFQGVIDDHRPMDNVPLGFDLPQEDELATNVLSAGTSPYMPLWFMQQEPDFRPYYAFDDRLDTDSDEYLEPSRMAAARKQWIDSFLHLLRKLTVREEKERNSHSSTMHSKPRRLLLKSPVHTARMPLLLQLFPDAQFVYVHRHPYDILRSAMHMADTTYWYTYLNTPSDDQIMKFILRQYEILFDRYESGRRQIEEIQQQTQQQQSLVEVSFDELSQRPIETVRRIYKALGWTMTSSFHESLVEELVTVHSYQRNAHKELPDRLKRI